MAFNLSRLFGADSPVSPGSIGGKMKKYRELHGWSQKELGIRCGFSDSTADVRIAQYEKNRKTPRENALTAISKALELDEGALFDADLVSTSRMYHALFDIEDFHGLHPVKIKDRYYLEFSGPSYLNPRGDFEPSYNRFLAEWYEKRQKLQPINSDTPEETISKAKEYTLWRGEYPKNIAALNTERLQDHLKMQHLQAEMDALKAKMQNDEELAKIDQALEPVLPEIRAKYQPVRKESDFIYLIKDLLQSGLRIEMGAPADINRPIDGRGDDVSLLSVRTEDILQNDEAKSLFSYIVCAIETLRQHGISVQRKVTCLCNEFYLTYCFPESEWEYFENLHRHWNDLFYINERVGSWTEKELAPLEEKLRADITGENDVAYSGKDDEV